MKESEHSSHNIMYRIVFLVPVIIGVLLIISGLILRKKPRGRVKNGIFTEALVIDTAEREAFLKRSPYKAKAPIVEYETEKGYVRAIYPYFVHEDYYKYRPGDTIKICYNRSNTNKFHIEEDGSHSEISACLIGGGAFIIASALILWLRYFVF